jgi:hypothetical protein
MTTGKNGEARKKTTFAPAAEKKTKRRQRSATRKVKGGKSVYSRRAL